MKPKTSGLSAGPTAYWDARSDAAKDAEIKRLRKLVEDIHQCGDISPGLWDRILKEVGDE